MHRLRFAIFGAAAALALGTATAFAVEQTAGPGTDPDQHGDNVASAARNCPHGANGVHGECVSAIASSKSEGSENEGSESARDAAVDACKAKDKTEAPETKPADKAAKATDKTEDKNERAALKACIQAAVGSTK